MKDPSESNSNPKFPNFRSRSKPANGFLNDPPESNSNPKFPNFHTRSKPVDNMMNDPPESNSNLKFPNFHSQPKPVYSMLNDPPDSNSNPKFPNFNTQTNPPPGFLNDPSESNFISSLSDLRFFDFVNGPRESKLKLAKSKADKEEQEEQQPPFSARLIQTLGTFSARLIQKLGGIEKLRRVGFLCVQYVVFACLIVFFCGLVRDMVVYDYGQIVFKPVDPKLRIESAVLSSIDVAASGTELTARWDMSVLFVNPNQKLPVKFKTLQVMVYYLGDGSTYSSDILVAMPVAAPSLLNHSDQSCVRFQLATANNAYVSREAGDQISETMARGGSLFFGIKVQSWWAFGNHKLGRDDGYYFIKQAKSYEFVFNVTNGSSWTTREPRFFGIWQFDYARSEKILFRTP